ncbi:Deoxyribonuclease-2-like protein [Leptotrombidium deliense]|uniref:Deoxyribonuclease-2-like protein n=1 Tax=Leptotrombidium deliense TaxID=299467 RepID=A0A443RTK8_9ACAR|nr:Deoxyribonuclease-2-like protein [Leptotrombidium deliense]
MSSIKKTELVMFAKNGESTFDLYKTKIAPFIKSDLFVESWRRGNGIPLSSNCHSKYKLINVQYVKLKFENKYVGNVLWKYSEDHSKWLISEDSEKAFICIVDLNRMLSQNKRGGGAVCIRDASIWKLFHDSIAAIETCIKL